MSLSFNDLMKEQEWMIKGSSALILPENAALNSMAHALEEQAEDLVFVLGEASKENLADMQQGLEEACRGFIQAAQGFRTMRLVGKQLKESEDLELPKIGSVVDKVSASYEDVGRTLKNLLVAVKQARAARV